MERVGVYCRLSLEDKDKINKSEDSNSIKNQKSMCLKYATDKNWDIIDIYSDDDYSGAGVHRPDFERLIKDCESGRINLVLCKSQSRFSRDIEVIEKYLHHLFIKWNVRFVSIIDNADTNDYSNKKSRQINGLMNEWYLDDLSQNIKKSLKSKREDGLFMGSFAPYGYTKKDKHKLIIDPVAANIVKTIFDKYVNGDGYYKIATYLNNQNILAPSNYKKSNGSKFVCANNKYKNSVWTTDTIARILRNEIYIGNLVQGKSVSLGYKVHKSVLTNKKDWCRVNNTHEAIIDIDTWNAVVKRLDKHDKPIKNGNVHIFSQKVYCECCNKVFMRNVFKSGESKKAYLQCKGSKKYNLCTNNSSIRIEDLEDIIITSINKMIKTYYDKEKIEKTLTTSLKQNSKSNNLITSLETEKNNIDKKILNNKEYLKKLYEDRVREIITEDIFLNLMNDYTNENQILNLRKEKIDKEIESIEIINKNKIDLDIVLKKYKKIKKLNKVIIDELVEKVLIGKKDKNTKKRKIEIVWNFNI